MTDELRTADRRRLSDAIEALESAVEKLQEPQRADLPPWLKRGLQALVPILMALGGWMWAQHAAVVSMDETLKSIKGDLQSLEEQVLFHARSPHVSPDRVDRIETRVERLEGGR